MTTNKSALANLHRMIQESQKEMPTEASFLADLKRSVEMEEDNKTKRKLEGKIILPSQSYKPSSMNCIRNMYYQMTAEPILQSPRSYAMTRIAESGTAAHRDLQRHIMRMKDNGMQCDYIYVPDYIHSFALNHLEILTLPTEDEPETKLWDTRYNIRFKCDGIIRYKSNYYILEIKTETSKKNMLRKQVEDKHIRQACSYSLSLGINNVIFLYEGRDFCEAKSYLFPVTNAMREEYVINPINECNHYIEIKTIPPKPINAGNALCQYCDYIQSCKKAG